MVSFGHDARVSAGTLANRSEMWEDGAAGVASVSSEVATLPIALPRAFMISKVVLKPAFEPGTFNPVLGPCETRVSVVFLPVDQAVAVGAESGT